MKRKEFINELVKHGFTVEEAEELVNNTENLSLEGIKDFSKLLYNQCLLLLKTQKGKKRKLLENLLLDWPGNEEEMN